MDTNPHHWLAALRRSHDQLASLVATLEPDQLRGPSYCDDWTVAQVLSHLGSGAEIFDLMLERVRNGEGPPGPDAFPPIWERWNGKSPDQQAADSVTADKHQVATLEALGDDLDALSVSAFGMELDGAGFIGLRLGEHALHTWDVAVSFDPAAHVDAGAVTLLIDRLPLMAGFLGRSADTEPLSLTLHTSDPARTFSIDADDAVRLTEVSDPRAAVDLEIPAEALLRLVYGRLDPEHAPPETSGPESSVVDQLRKVFPGF
jgi:uncharacterized protein (TIGR03083 family)